MGTKGSLNRTRIVDAAGQLFYSRGYSQTSFSDIAEATGIPRGNFYYYFRSKDDILEAVVDARIVVVEDFLAECDKASDDAVIRIEYFINTLERSAEDILEFGCPIGTLSTELAKDQAVTLKNKSRELFDVLEAWLIRQFAEVGLSEDKQRPLALDLIARLQGVTVVANAYNDAEFLQQSASDLREWIEQTLR